MELLREWFLWGESDLFFYGIGIILIAALFPWRQNKDRKNLRIILACAAIYGFCEIVVTFRFQSWLWAYLCLFAGGVALSVALGRIVKMVFRKAFRPRP